jgi:hypothetical protein
MLSWFLRSEHAMFYRALEMFLWGEIELVQKLHTLRESWLTSGPSKAWQALECFGRQARIKKKSAYFQHSPNTRGAGMSNGSS